VTAATTYQLTRALPALPVTLLIISFALPPETSLSIGSLRLSPYRIALIILLLPAINILMQNRKTPACLVDGLVLMHSTWAASSLTITMGISNGGETAGIYFIETFGSYVVARAYVQNLEDFIKVIRLVFTVTAALLVFAAAEAFSGIHLLREPFKAVFGGAGPHVIEPRLGLTRAFTSFEHPILFGVFSASGLASTYYVLCGGKLTNGAIKKLSVVVGATFFSLSSGPFTALVFQGALIGWDRITEGISNRWKLLLGIVAAMWIFLSLISNRSPVLVFISYLTFSAASAYNRVHIWEYGTAEVARHPLFGLGLNDWIRAPWMSASMDNYWLLTTMRYGLPATLFLLLAIIFLVRRQRAMKTQDIAMKNARKAWLVTFFGFALAGLTVHFWNGLMVQFFFFIGCGMALIVSMNRPLPSQYIRVQQKKRQLSWI